MRKISHFIQWDARLHRIATHPRLLALVERLIEAQPGIFEDKALIKPPRVGREKPWHQDHAYWNLPLDAHVVTVWIALDAATVDNGCLYVIPGSHREGPVVHFKRRDWQICDDQVQTERAVAAPLRPGGAAALPQLPPARHAGQRLGPSAGGPCSSSTSPRTAGGSPPRSAWPSSAAKAKTSPADARARAAPSQASPPRSRLTAPARSPAVAAPSPVRGSS